MGRPDLVLPILWVDSPVLSLAPSESRDQLISYVESKQWTDWTSHTAKAVDDFDLDLRKDVDSFARLVAEKLHAEDGARVAAEKRLREEERKREEEKRRLEEEKRLAEERKVALEALTGAENAHADAVQALGQATMAARKLGLSVRKYERMISVQPSDKQKLRTWGEAFLFRPLPIWGFLFVLSLYSALSWIFIVSSFETGAFGVLRHNASSDIYSLSFFAPVYLFLFFVLLRKYGGMALGLIWLLFLFLFLLSLGFFIYDKATYYASGEGVSRSFLLHTSYLVYVSASAIASILAAMICGIALWMFKGALALMRSMQNSQPVTNP